jgi:hypothetical protein
MHCFSDKFVQGVNAYPRNEEYCKLVVWCSFVDYVAIFLVRLAFQYNVLALYFHSARAVGRFLCYGFGSIRRSVLVRFWLVLLFLSVGLSDVLNACRPASEGGMRSDMGNRPVMSVLAHSLTHSAFSLLCSDRCSFAMVVVSVAGSSSVC